MKVELLHYTKDCEKLISLAAKLCYSASGIEGIQDNLTEEGANKFLNMLMEIGHQSPIEHASFTFGIEGVSRSLLAQLTRHRIASYSVKSQRYVKEGQFEFIIPPNIESDSVANTIYLKTMEVVQEAYNAITKVLFEKHFENLIEEGQDEKTAKKTAEKLAIEDARYVLPNACETKVIMTFNARSLINFFEHRCCERAQWEIRELADKMLWLVKEVAPTLFKKCGPSCVKGPCPEGKMCCGKMKEKREKYK